MAGRVGVRQAVGPVALPLPHRRLWPFGLAAPHADRGTHRGIEPTSGIDGKPQVGPSAPFGYEVAVTVGCRVSAHGVDASSDLLVASWPPAPNATADGAGTFG